MWIWPIVGENQRKRGYELKGRRTWMWLEEGSWEWLEGEKKGK